MPLDLMLDFSVQTIDDRTELIAVGQRVRVVDGGMLEYGQLGTVIARGSEAGWYVRLDDAAADYLFFQPEELALVARQESEHLPGRLAIAA